MTLFLGDPREVVWGRGPLAAVSEPPRGGWAFLHLNFAGFTPSPWLVPSGGVEIVPRNTSLAPSPEIIDVRWEALDSVLFAESLGELAELRHQGRLEKAVPVVFEEGRAGRPPKELWSLLAAHACGAPRELWPYGARFGERGFVGLSPELLLEVEGRRVRTMALAGSAPLEDEARLLQDPKEIREHELVVRDLLERLRPWGRVESREREVHRLPGILHLRTLIEGELESALSPSELLRLVRDLHPTAALGAYPRGPVADAWLSRQAESVSRGSFGAPFGLLRPDGSFRVVVAIRRVDFEGLRIRLGAGCGIVEGSRLEREWAELALKRASVKKHLGLSP